MARYYGQIGYVISNETVPGVWMDEVIEKTYRGDIVLNQQRWQPSEGITENFNLDNSISIVADEFAYANSGRMRYVTWHGQKWKIQSLSIKRPRITLQIGGLYNGG